MLAKTHYLSSVRIFLFAIIAVTAQIARAQVSPLNGGNAVVPSCGVRSVINLSRSSGNTLDENQLKNLYKDYPQDSLSMFDVQQAAKKVGIQVEGIKATLSELEMRKQPFIAFLPNHFVFVQCIEGDWVRYSEDQGFITTPRAQFETLYQGKALVLSAKEERTALQVSPSFIYWKQVPIGPVEKTATINLINTSDKSIKITNISNSCSCTVPSQWPRQLLPHQSVPLQITMRMPSSGEFSQTVSIFPKVGTFSQIVSLFGRIETDISIDPANIEFGEVASGKGETRILSVRDIDHKLPRPLQVATTNKNLTASLKSQTKDSWEVTVSVPAMMPLGEVDGELLISGQIQGSRVVHIPIHARIVTMTRSRPGQIVFGSIAPEGATRRLQFFRQDRQPFEVLKVEAPAYLTCQVEAANGRQTEWSARVSIAPAKAPSQVTDKIVVRIKCSDQEENIVVPVLALNESSITPVLPGTAQAALLPRAENDHETHIGLPLPRIKVGEEAPDFRVVDANGNPWHLNALRGQKNVLLTFFPKCFTGGCATQLSSVRDHQSDFDASQTQILAVSIDPAEGDQGQLAFAKQWGFLFPLIPDTRRVLGKQFGAIQNDDERAARLSFLIDKQGIVRWIDTDVHVQTHGTDVLAKIHELGLDH